MLSFKASALGAAALLVCLLVAHPVSGQTSDFDPFTIDDPTPAAGQTITVSGSGCIGKWVRLVVRQRFPDAIVDFHSADDSVAIDPDGSWVAHGVVRDDAAAGTVLEVAAWCKRSTSDPYPLATVTVSAAATDPVQVLELPPAGSFVVGRTVDFAGRGCAPGTTAYVTVGRQAEVLQASGTVGDDGSWTASGTVLRGKGSTVVGATCGAPGLADEGVKLYYRRSFVTIRTADEPGPTTTSLPELPPSTAITTQPVGSQAAPGAVAIPGTPVFTG